MTQTNQPTTGPKKKNQKKNRPGKQPVAAGGVQDQRPRKTPAQRLDDKLAAAARPDTSVVTRKALDTNAMINLLGSNDYYMYQIRMNVGINPDITMEKAAEIFEKSRDIKLKLNELNQEMADLLGKEYSAPRSMDIYLGAGSADADGGAKAATA